MSDIQRYAHDDDDGFPNSFQPDPEGKWMKADEVVEALRQAEQRATRAEVRLASATLIAWRQGEERGQRDERAACQERVHLAVAAARAEERAAAVQRVEALLVPVGGPDNRLLAEIIAAIKEETA